MFYHCCCCCICNVVPVVLEATAQYQTLETMLCFRSGELLHETEGTSYTILYAMLGIQTQQTRRNSGSAVV